MPRDNGPVRDQRDPSTIMVMIALPVGQWQRVMDMLGRSPWHESNPFIAMIAQHIRAQMESPPTREAEDGQSQAG